MPQVRLRVHPPPGKLRMRHADDAHGRPQHGQHEPCYSAAPRPLPTASSDSRSAPSIRRLAIWSWPSMHLAYTLSSTATLCPADSATWGGTPPLSHVDTQ